MSSLRKLFFHSGWLLFVAVVGCFVAAVGGLRLQLPENKPHNFALSDLHCWVYPCLIAHEPKEFWQRYSAIQISNPVLVPLLTSEVSIVAVTDRGDVYLWAGCRKAQAYTRPARPGSDYLPRGGARRHDCGGQ